MKNYKRIEALEKNPREFLNDKANRKHCVIKGFELFSPEAKITFTDSKGNRMTMTVKAEPLATWHYRINQLLDEYFIDQHSREDYITVNGVDMLVDPGNGYPDDPIELA